MTRRDGQIVAARPGSSAWVRANAGTGKTKVLTDRVLRLLVGGTAPERILCLTFTRAAAAEMANRIRDRLGAWAQAEPEELRAELAELLETPPDDRALARARDLFPLVLDTPGGMRLQTIHAFCEVVLGRFPLEARIPPWFSVMDERTQQETMRAALDRIVGGGPGAALAKVTGRTAEDGFDQVMARLAAGRARMAGDSDAIFACLGLEPGQTAGALLAEACHDSAFDRGELLDAADALDRGSGTDREHGRRIETWIVDSEHREAGFADYANVFLTRAGGIRTRLATKAVAEAAPDVPGVLTVEAERLAGIEEKRRACEIAEASAALAQVGEALLGVYESEKRARLRLDYDDLIDRTRRLLESAGAAWVHYKLDHGIDHVLIDEAQDTNPEQWAVIQALTEEFFSDMGVGGPPGQAARTVFAVGDPKQSIFGFQGADPRWFAEMEKRFRSRVEARGARWDSVTLDTSFRSTEPVLTAVDAVLDRLGDGLGVEAAARHSAHRTGQAGEVVLWPAAKEPDAPEIDPLDPPRPGERRMSSAQRLAEAMAARIAEWIQAGTPLPSRGRSIRAGDVLVLVRRRTAFVDHLVRALKNAQVGVAGIDRLVLSDQLAVMDLLALGEAALLPDDDLTMASVLKGPLFGIDEETLFELAHGRGTASLFSCLADRPDLARHFEELKTIMAAAESAPPFEFYMRILSAMGGRTRSLARLGPDAEDPIDEFLALALEYERERPPSLQGFVAWFRAAATEVKRDLERAERDEVRVMTVHGAKGLEAPVVILADTMQVPTKTDPILWVENEGRQVPLWRPRRENEDPRTAELRLEAERRRDEEYWRLLYVAMTRAQDQLHVAGYETRRKPPESCWYNVVRNTLKPIAETFEMTLGTPGIEPWTGPAFRLSSPQSRPPDRADPGSAAAPSVRPLPPWAARPAPAEPAPLPSFAPSRMDGDPAAPGPFADGAAEAGARRGRLVHDLLRTLPALVESERATAAAVYLARPALGLSREARDEIAAEALSVLTGERTAPFFGPGARAEAPVAGRIGGRVWSGRIDLLKVGRTTVDVVEFKTVRRPPARAADAPAAWLRQLAAYRALVSKLHPGREIRCFLVWTVGPRVDRIPDAVLDRRAVAFGNSSLSAP